MVKRSKSEVKYQDGLHAQDVTWTGPERLSWYRKSATNDEWTREVLTPKSGGTKAPLDMHIYDLCNPIVGTGPSGRIGRHIRVKRIAVGLRLDFGNAHFGGMRIVLVRDTQPNAQTGITQSVDTYFKDPQNAAFSPPEPDQLGRFKTLKDITVYGVPDWNKQQIIDFYVNQNVQQTLDNSTHSISAFTNAYYLILCPMQIIDTSNAIPAVSLAYTLDSRVQYTDE